jgi:hypothetical protein
MADPDATLPPTVTDPTATLPPDADAGPDPTLTFGPARPAAPAGPPAVPGFEIEREIGRGGMGVVYLARQTGLNRPTALKMVLAGGHAGADERRRFLLEAEAVAAVRHPGVVQVYAVGTAGDQPYLALEFCPGGSLSGRLAGTPLPPRAAAELVERVARAVEAAHAAGVVHRDLKPDNVLFAADGTPKVTDFGLARVAAADSRLTATGAVMGTPSYMAPEQADGSKGIGPAADVWALGAILYECRSGRPPFRAATVLDTLRQVATADPVPPRQLQPGLPRDLDTVCLKCLQKDPRRRYASAAALADDLARFLRGEPVTARPVSGVERTWKAVRRRPAAAAVALAGAVAAVAVVGVVVWSNGRLATERDAARAAERDADEQRRAAEAEREAAAAARDRAERRLVVALDAVERMLVRTAGERWARDPALQAERRAVLEDAVAVFRGFSAEDSKDPRVRRQTALAEGRVAAVYLALADYDRAGRAAAAAEATLADLAAADPADPGLARDLGMALIMSGHAHVLAARFEDARVRYTRAVAEARRAAGLAPDRDEYALALVEALHALGHFHANAPNGTGLIYYAEAVEHARRLAARPDPGYGPRLFLAAGLLNLASRTGSAETAGEAEALLAGLAGQPPPSARWAELYDACRGMADLARAARLLIRAGDPAGALAAADAARARFDALLAVQPRSLPHQMYKLNALNLRADALRRLGRAAEAAATTRELLAYADAVAAGSPSLGWVRTMHAVRRSALLVERCREGPVADLDRAVAELLATTGPPGDTVRYNVACARAQAARFGSPAEREGRAAAAVADLEALARGGYFRVPANAALARTDDDLDPLRGRADFRRFLAGLGRPVAPPPRPAAR